MTLTDTTPAGAGDGRRRALPASVVRITADDGGGTTAGTGFLVAADTVVTCAHVVRAAGGEPGGRVRLAFPHLPGAPWAEGHVLSGAWREPQAQDIAVLRLESAPAGAEPVALGSAEDGRGHRISSFGFPVQAPEGGHFGYGTAGDLLPAGEAGTLLQLTGANDLTTGFSGGPVLDETTGLVIGMVTAITGPDRHSRGAGIAYATPAWQLREVLPELTEHQVCPYRGLEPFTAEHAGWFHGRGAAVEEVLAKLGGQRRAMLLLGPSGAGKSSLVQAGVLPALAEGGLPGSDRWLPVLARPGQDLPAELEHAGLPGAASEGVLSAVESRLAGEPAGRRLLLVVDQFEELLTQPVPDGARDRDGDGDERLAAAERQLVELIRSQTAVSLVLVMRDDFYPRLAARAPDLLKALTPGLLNVPATLSAADLRAIVIAPAEAVGLRLEDGLPERIIADVLAAAPSASLSRQAPVTLLPPLELALSQLWERREDGRLTHWAYGRIGEVDGSLATWCGAALDRLPAEHRPMARRVLTALVRPADDTHAVPATRRHVPLADLRALAAGPQSAPSDGQAADQAFDAVLAALTRHRIVTTRTTPRPDGTPGRATAELVHDALVRDWAELRDWVAQDHDFHAWLHRAEERQARHAASGLPGDLLDGTDLTEGLDWSAKRGLPPHVSGFLTASRQRQRAVIRRTRRINAFLASALVLALLAAGGALWQRQIALTAQKEAESRQLAAQSTALLGTDPDLASLLAVQAYKTSPTREAAAALHTAAARPLLHVLDGVVGDANSMVFVPGSGTTLAIADDYGTVGLWDGKTGKAVRDLIEHTGDMEPAVLSPDGGVLATGGDGDGARLWDTSTGEVLRTLPSHGAGRVTTMTFSPNGEVLAVGGDNGTVRLWNTVTGETYRPFLTDGGDGGDSDDGGDDVEIMAFSPDGRILATTSGSYGEGVRLWDVGTGEGRPTHSIDTRSVSAMVFVPGSGTTLAVADGYGTVGLWDAKTGKAVRDLTERSGEVGAMVFTPSGDVLATGDSNGVVRLWNPKTGKARSTFPTGHIGGVGMMTFSPDGRALATSEASSSDAFGGEVRLWNVAERRVRDGLAVEHPSMVVSVGFDAEGRALAAEVDDDKQIHVRDVGTGRKRQTMAGRVDDPGSAAFSPEGEFLAIADGDDKLRIWDVSTGEALETLSTGPSSWLSSVVFAPDGEVLAAVADGEVRLWGTDSWKAHDTPSARHQGMADKVAFASGGRLAVVGRGDSTSYFVASGDEVQVQVWDLEATEVREEFSIGRFGRRFVVNAAFAPDGRTVAVATGGFKAEVRVEVWDAKTGVLRGTLPDGGSGEGPEVSGAGPPADGRSCHDASMAFDPSGAVLAVGCDPGGVRLWDVGTGKVRDTLTDHLGAVDSVVFGPGGGLIAAGNEVRAGVWEAAILAPEEMIGKICEGLSSNHWPIRRESSLTHRLPDWVCPP